MKNTQIIRKITFRNVLFLLFGAASLVSFTSCKASVADISTPVSAASDVPFLAEGDPEVRNVLEQIHKIPDSPLGYDQLAIVYIKRARSTGDFTLNQKAFAAVDKALEIAPGDVRTRKLKATLLLAYHKFDEALALGQELERDSPDDALVYGILTDANFELGKYEDAVKSAQKMVDLRPNSASYARVAHLRSFYGDTKGAIETYKMAARTADPADFEAQSWCLTQLGDEYWKYGKYADAERTYDEALQILPNYYLAMISKGRLLISVNKLGDAEKILTDATEKIPNVEGTILLGNIYEKQGMQDKAARQYELVEVIEAKLGVNNDQKRLALLWADQNTNLDKSFEIVNRESQMRNDILTNDALAWTLYKRGDFAGAKTAITSALRLKSNDAKMHFHAGMIAKAQGNTAEAKQHLQKAVSLNPEFDPLLAETAKSTLRDLK